MQLPAYAVRKHVQFLVDRGVAHHFGAALPAPQDAHLPAQGFSAQTAAASGEQLTIAVAHLLRHLRFVGVHRDDGRAGGSLVLYVCGALGSERLLSVQAGDVLHPGPALREHVPVELRQVRRLEARALDRGLAAVDPGQLIGINMTAYNLPGTCDTAKPPLPLIASIGTIGLVSIRLARLSTSCALLRHRVVRGEHHSVLAPAVGQPLHVYMALD